MRKILLLLLISYCWAAPAEGQPRVTPPADTTMRPPEGLPSSAWVVVGAGADNATVSANPARMRVLPNGLVRAWLRWSTPNGDVLEWLDGSPRSFTSLAEVEINCSTQERRTLRSVYYDRGGSVLDRDEAATEWRGVVPDSVGEAYLLEICGFLGLL